MTGTAFELLDLCLISVTNLSLRLYLQGCFSPSFFFLTQSPGADISIFRYCCYVLQIADHLAATLPEGASRGHEPRILLGKSDIPAHVDFYVLKISAMPDKTLTNTVVKTTPSSGRWCCSIACSLAMSGTATARHKRISQGGGQEEIFYEAHPTPSPDEIKAQCSRRGWIGPGKDCQAVQQRHMRTMQSHSAGSKASFSRTTGPRAIAATRKRSAGTRRCRT